jgi:hypothetical protein
MNKETKQKNLINLDDLAPKEQVKGGSSKGKRIFGAFDDKKKNLPKNTF